MDIKERIREEISIFLFLFFVAFFKLVLFEARVFPLHYLLYFTLFLYYDILLQRPEIEPLREVVAIFDFDFQLEYLF